MTKSRSATSVRIRSTGSGERPRRRLTRHRADRGTDDLGDLVPEEAARVRRVDPAVERVERVPRRHGRHHVGDDDAPARAAHPRHLRDLHRGPEEVVQRAAAHHEVEGRVHEREARGVALLQQHVPRCPRPRGARRRAGAAPASCRCRRPDGRAAPPPRRRARRRTRRRGRASRGRAAPATRPGRATGGAKTESSPVKRSVWPAKDRRVVSSWSRVSRSLVLMGPSYTPGR